ncbi:ABC transporter permease [Streptomyces althioticus]|jgi:putative ABC transport system permease protein|uniref:ABC transporter permease n=3 Tax=Actinomycetes TaxID=1760 RepID=A0A9X5HCE3_9ACTN|nr:MULTISPECIES: ABC transporter permease [Actinomycetes]ALV52643.1 macrolide ABC transporter permease [Streptomyces sp. 4F]MCC9688708.1 ABC transporter permease [Streptomyces sp. MNU103]MDT3728052.1 ABC transporter permease [Streptomyces sp. DSM 41972]WTC22594.1 ABC transporter permease [Streptomyces althioticus]SCD45829.1 putative ABC transport system permease protein [Streptomyces sp. di50b]SCE47824.1 putative ABC transport system permease protein [Streptomyces sp. di188]
MLILANVRERWSGFLGAFVAVLVGVALITTTLVIYDSAKAKVQPRYQGTAALALPPQAVDADGSPKDRMPWSTSEAEPLVSGLEKVPGVADAVVDHSFYAQAIKDGKPVTDEGALEAGHGFSSARMAPYELVSGRAPAAADEVVVDRALGAAVGSELTVNVTQGREQFKVVGTVDGPGYYFSEQFAARQQPGVATIALIPDKGADTGAIVTAAKKVVGEHGSVVSGDGRAELQPEYIEHKRFLGVQLISAMAILGLFTTVFVVASMLVLSTGMRRREIGLLRTIGASPKQIRRMILGEAAVVGLAGSVVGCVAGVAATPLLLSILKGLDVTPPGMQITIAAWPLLVASAIGVGVSVIGAWSAGRKAAKVAPIEALLDSRSANKGMGRGRWIAGLSVLGAGVLLAVGTATSTADDRINMAIFATMTLIVAAALLAPVFVAPVGRILTAPFQRGGKAAPVLVRAELVANPRRAASLVAPVIAAVGFAVLLSGMVETMRVAYPAGEALKVAGQTIVTPDGTPGNTDEVVAANPVGKAALPTRAFVETEKARDAETAGAATVLDVLGSRDPKWNKPGQAVLGEKMAGELGLKQGQDVPVRFADGATVTLTVAEVLPDDPARGDFVVARDLVRAHDPAALTDDIFVPAGAKASDAVPGVALHDAVEFALADYNTDAKLTDSLAMMLIVIAVGYSVIAVANSMAMAAHGRRRDFGVMKSAGGTVRQLLFTSAGETTLVVAVGAALGVLVTLPPLAGMAAGLSEATSSDVGLHLNSGVIVTAVIGTLAAAVLAGIAVTSKTLKRQAA